MNRVSLITGCFNGEKFIDRCFSSILAQTYSDIEVIFVDDGSTDNSLKLAESFRDKFAVKGYRFHVIAQENMGFYPQSGIKVATGKYITTLDIDDILLPDSIRKRAAQLNENPDFAASRSNGYVVYQDDPLPPTELLIHVESEEQNVFKSLLFGKTTNIPGTYMVRAEILFEYYPDRIVPMNRYTQNLQILLPVTYKRKVGLIPAPLMEYYRHDEAFTAAQIDYESRYRQFESFKEVRKNILNRMNLMTPEIETKLDRIYKSIFLGLAHKYNKVQEFNNLFMQVAEPNFNERLLHASLNKKKLRHFFLQLQKKLGLIR